MTTDLGSFDITGLAAELVANGHDDWAGKVEAIRRDYVSAMRDVASVFHPDAMDWVRERTEQLAPTEQFPHGIPLSALARVLLELVGENSAKETQ